MKSSSTVHTVALWTFTFHEKKRLCAVDLEGQFQTSLKSKLIFLSSPIECVAWEQTELLRTEITGLFCCCCFEEFFDEIFDEFFDDIFDEFLDKFF